VNPIDEKGYLTFIITKEKGYLTLGTKEKGYLTLGSWSFQRKKTLVLAYLKKNGALNSYIRRVWKEILSFNVLYVILFYFYTRSYFYDLNM